VAINRIDLDGGECKFLRNVGIHQSTWRHIQEDNGTAQFFRSLTLSFLRKMRKAYKILVGKSYQGDLFLVHDEHMVKISISSV
jgi:hypothetical protein